MICVSVWVKYIRNRIMAEIKKLNVYFGIHGEKLSMMRQLRGAIKEIMQLSFITATLIISAGTFQILYYVVLKHRIFQMISIYLNLLYILTNPFVYMTVMKDLRAHYMTRLRKLWTVFHSGVFQSQLDEEHRFQPVEGRRPQPTEVFQEINELPTQKVGGDQAEGTIELQPVKGIAQPQSPDETEQSS